MSTLRPSDERRTLREEGEHAFALWASLGRPKLCPCCGAWLKPDGTTGPRLPHCTRHIDNPVDGDTSPVWTHAESCGRIAESDYADRLCPRCESARGR